VLWRGEAGGGALASGAAKVYRQRRERDMRAPERALFLCKAVLVRMDPVQLAGSPVGQDPAPLLVSR